MPAPATLATVGVQRPGMPFPDMAATRDHDRFADVRAIRMGRMPNVVPGQVWADGDSRCAGRTVRVLAIRRDGKAVVETITPRTAAPRTPGKFSRDTIGALSVIAIRRFRSGSRGFSLVSEAPKAKKKRASRTGVGLSAPTAPPAVGVAPPSDGQLQGTQAQVIESVASLLAGSNPVLALDYRAAAALCGLLGADRAIIFLDSTANGQTPVRRYNDHGIGVLLIAAADWAASNGLIAEWSKDSAH